MGGAAAPVEIKLFGKDLPTLKGQADQIVQLISGIEGLRDLTHTLAAGKPEVQIHIDRERAYRLGLSVYQVANTVQTATLGKVATRYREGSDEIDVRLRFKEKYRDSLDEVRSIPLRTAAGQTIYLEQVADISSGEGPIMINRENQARRVSVTANIVGRDLGSVVKDIKARLAGFEKSLPPGYFLEYGGSYEQMQDAFLILAGAFALAILLVYMVMASQFEHFVHPFIIMFTVPLGIIGVIIGLLVTGPDAQPARADRGHPARRDRRQQRHRHDRLHQPAHQAGRGQAGGHPAGIDDASAGRPADRPDDHPGHAAHGLLPIVGLRVPGPAGRGHRLRPDRDDLPDALRHPGHLQHIQQDTIQGEEGAGGFKSPSAWISGLVRLKTRPC